MMGQQKSEPQLFNYAVNLEKRVRANHPLRQIKALIDFSFVREEVAHCHGTNGNELVDPEVPEKVLARVAKKYQVDQKRLVARGERGLDARNVAMWMIWETGSKSLREIGETFRRAGLCCGGPEDSPDTTSS